MVTDVWLQRSLVSPWRWVTRLQVLGGGPVFMMFRYNTKERRSDGGVGGFFGDAELGFKGV